MFSFFKDLPSKNVLISLLFSYIYFNGELEIQNILIVLLKSTKLYTLIEHPVPSQKMTQFSGLSLQVDFQRNINRFIFCF